MRDEKRRVAEDAIMHVMSTCNPYVTKGLESAQILCILR